MKLHHYSLLKPPIRLRLNPQTHILQLTRTKVERLEKVLYTTTEPYTNPALANRMLSLTYYPKYDTVIDADSINGLEIVDNNYNALLLEDALSASRVWPAFAKPGGSHEILITKPDVINATPNLLPDGGAPEAWFQDDVQNYDLDIAQAIATGMVDALEAEDLLHRERYIAKTIVHGLALTLPSKEMNVTLSAAWKNLTLLPEFKFWACLWADSDKLRTRFILDPFAEQLVLGPFFLCRLSDKEIKKYINNILRKRSCIHCLFTETIRSLLKKIILVKDGFFISHCRKIVIPA